MKSNDKYEHNTKLDYDLTRELIINDLLYFFLEPEDLKQLKAIPDLQGVKLFLDNYQGYNKSELKEVYQFMIETSLNGQVASDYSKKIEELEKREFQLRDAFCLRQRKTAGTSSTKLTAPVGPAALFPSAAPLHTFNVLVMEDGQASKKEVLSFLKNCSQKDSYGNYEKTVQTSNGVIKFNILCFSAPNTYTDHNPQKRYPSLDGIIAFFDITDRKELHKQCENLSSCYLDIMKRNSQVMIVGNKFSSGTATELFERNPQKVASEALSSHRITYMEILETHSSAEKVLCPLAKELLNPRQVQHLSLEALEERNHTDALTKRH